MMPRASILKRVLFDQNVPRPIRRFLAACEVKVADEMGWSSMKNGLLLIAAEQADFDVLLSCDKSMQYEQTMTGRKIGVVAMSDNHWNLVRPYVRQIAQAIYQVNPGDVRAVFCGQFVPGKFRKSDNPSC